MKKYNTLMAKYEKKGFIPSTSEIVIKYKDRNSSGEMIIDTNMFNLLHKKIMKLLKDCEITLWIQRAKV